MTRARTIIASLLSSAGFAGCVDAGTSVQEPVGSDVHFLVRAPPGWSTDPARLRIQGPVSTSELSTFQSLYVADEEVFLVGLRKEGLRDRHPRVDIEAPFVLVARAAGLGDPVCASKQRVGDDTLELGLSSLGEAVVVHQLDASTGRLEPSADTGLENLISVQVGLSACPSRELVIESFSGALPYDDEYGWAIQDLRILDPDHLTFRDLDSLYVVHRGGLGRDDRRLPVEAAGLPEPTDNHEWVVREGALIGSADEARGLVVLAESVGGQASGLAHVFSVVLTSTSFRFGDRRWSAEERYPSPVDRGPIEALAIDVSGAWVAAGASGIVASERLDGPISECVPEPGFLGKFVVALGDGSFAIAASGGRLYVGRPWLGCSTLSRLDKGDNFTIVKLSTAVTRRGPRLFASIFDTSLQEVDPIAGTWSLIPQELLIGPATTCSVAEQCGLSVAATSATWLVAASTAGAETLFYSSRCSATVTAKDLASDCLYDAPLPTPSQFLGLEDVGLLSGESRGDLVVAGGDLGRILSLHLE